MKKITEMCMYWKQRVYTSKMKILPTNRMYLNYAMNWGQKKHGKNLG